MLSKEFVLSRRELKVRNYGAAGEVRINCPECGDDKYHMYCNLDKMVYFCQKCAARGKIVNSPREVSVQDFYNHNVPTKRIEGAKPNIVYSLPLYTRIIARSDVHPQAYDYLISRGVTQDEIIKYNVGRSNEANGPYKDTIIFPIYGSKGKLDYFVCRKWNNKSVPRYVNAPWPKNDTLFLTKPDNRIVCWSAVIVEGIFDALAVARAGYPGIAILGKKATTEQLLRIKSLPFKYFLIFLDSDEYSDAVRLKMELSELTNKEIRILVEPGGKDPADYALESVQNLTRLITSAWKR